MRFLATNTVISFQPFEERHLPLLRQWLNEEHIKGFWQETEDDLQLKEKFLVELPQRGVYPFIIVNEGTEIGYIQYYEASKVGGGWWPNEHPGSIGIDLMIGSASHVGRGLGALVIEEFISFMKSRESSVTSIIIDPDPTNSKAIRAFEKAGFSREGEIETPGGPAVLMRRRP